MGLWEWLVYLLSSTFCDKSPMEYAGLMLCPLSAFRVTNAKILP